MIPDPQNVFELLQNDVAAQIMATVPFTTLANPDGSTPFKVLTEDEGDIQFEYDQMIQQLGLSIVVHSPAGRIDQPDMPGPIITKLGFDVWVSEAPTFNRSEVGTGIRLWKATTIVLGTLHGFQPQSINSPVYADEVRLERERAYIEKDQPGTLIVSRICHFIAPQVAAQISASFPIIFIIQGSNTITVSGDASNLTGAITVSGSTGNDGIYTVVSVEYITGRKTHIIVLESIPDSTADGSVNGFI